MIGELLPILATFLLVNVILLVRAGARGQLRRAVASAPGQLPALQLAGAVAARPATPGPSNPWITEGPEPAIVDDLAAGDAAPDESEVGPAMARRDRDPVTELDGEATWDLRIAEEGARIRRYRRPVAIVRLELDGLDGLAGLLGEEARDRLLRSMADTLRRLARDTDHIARLGRGGFGVIMPETTTDAAARYVERVNRASERWLRTAAIAVRLIAGWAATSGEVDLRDSQRLATERMHDEQPCEAQRGGTVAVKGSAATAATRPPVTYVSCAPTPRLERGKCREPDCDHKKDHRRDRRR